MLTASALNSSEYRRRVFLVMSTSNASSMRLTGVSAPIRPVHLAAMETPADTAPQATGAGSGRPSGVEVSGKRARPLVERRRLAHESGLATEMVRAAGPDLGTRYGQEGLVVLREPPWYGTVCPVV